MKSDRASDGTLPEEMSEEMALESCNAPEEDSVLQKFYGGSSVLITGATGFMGKVLVEKLLRSCPDVARIFLLVRAKKGRTPKERVDDLLNTPFFGTVRNMAGVNPASKLTAIRGDVSAEGLGLSTEDFALLAASVDVVFHFAATVRFDAKLRTAIIQNVRGTRDLLALCHACAQLKAVVHVSTAYCNCPSKTIDECFYPAPTSSDLAIQLAEAFDEDALEKLAPGLVGEWPNTYVYTKLLSEDACLRFGDSLPLAIFRPSIVACTATEPESGWTDSLHGPSGIIVGSTTGILHTMQIDGDVDANIVPCDMAINAVLAAAWDVADTATRTAAFHPPIYNYVSPSTNRLTWRQYMDFHSEIIGLQPSNQAIWHVFLFFTTNRLSTLASRLFLHFLPALFVDTLLLVTGNKPRVITTYRNIHKFLEIINYFITQEWTFADDNVLALWERMGPKDRELFQFNMRDLKWRSYFKNSWIGIRRYLLKEDDSTIGLALRRKTRLQWLHWATGVLLVGLLLTWVLSSVDLVDLVPLTF